MAGRPGLRCWLRVACFGVAVLTAASSPPAAAAETIAKTKAPIEALAADNGRIAWSSGTCGKTVRILTLSTGKVVPAGSASGGVAGDTCDGYEDLRLALGRDQVVWGGIEGCCNNGYGSIFVGAPGRPQVLLAEYTQDYRWYGEFLTGLAGDTSTIVYSIVDVDLIPSSPDLDEWTPDPCLSGPPQCRFVVSSGQVNRVDGAKSVPVPDLPPAARLAVSDGRIALAPASTAITPDAEPRPRRGGPIEIRDAVSGQLARAFVPAGLVNDIAFEDGIVAVLTSVGRHREVAVYSAESGALRRSFAVDRRVERFDVSSTHVVFARNGIRAIELATGKRWLLARARAPVGLVIEGNDVVWAENRAEKGSIGRVELPRSGSSWSATRVPR